jgi:tetratricopeptide (TPR) repeat protein
MSEASSAAALHAARRSLAQGNLDAARASCLQILSREPQEAGALHLLGVIALRAGDRRTAQDYLRRAAESPKPQALYLLSYAELCLKGVEPATALSMTRRAVALDPNLVLGWLFLGTQLLEAREYQESRQCFERTLALDAKFWQAHVHLATLEVRHGDSARALERFRTLLEQRPGDAEVLAQYAAFLQDLGRPREALFQIERAIEAMPDSVEYRLRAADIELGLGHSEAALARLAPVADRAQRDPKFVAFEATLLRLTDRYDAAVTGCREALERGVESGELWRAYGRALHLAGQEREALAAFERAAAERPALALSERAVVLTELGRFPEALHSFDEALRHEPALAEAHYDRANVKTHRTGDPGIAAMERLLAAGCPYRDQVLLHFGLGKALHEAGDATAAFEHWHTANRLKRALLDYDAQVAEAELAAIAVAPAGRAVPSEIASEAQAQRSQLPVFIVGMPRCGSSLLEQILASHPQIHGAGEQTRLRALFTPYLDGTAALDDAPALERTAAAALDSLRRHSASAARVIDKDLGHFKHVGIIHRLFPKARIVHCRRDALDTCFSAYTKLFLGDFPFTYDMAELGGYYRAHRALMDHWRTVIPSSRLLELDYETLIAQPRESTQRLLDFLELPWDGACLRFFETRRAVNTASLSQVRQPIYRSSIGRAQGVLEHLGPLAAALGEPQTGTAR